MCKGRKTRIALFQLVKVILLVLIPVLSTAQQDAGMGLPALIRGDERFGADLLLRVHSTTPARNVVVSPLSLTLTFAALQTGMGYGPASEEIGSVFGWGKNPRLSVPARMLLAAFDKTTTVQASDGQGRTEESIHVPARRDVDYQYRLVPGYTRERTYPVMVYGDGEQVLRNGIQEHGDRKTDHC